MQQKDVLPMKPEAATKPAAATAEKLHITGSEAVIRSLIAEDVKTLADKAKKNSLKPADYEVKDNLSAS